MSIDAAGKFAFVANYFGGTIAVFPIAREGRLQLPRRTLSIRTAGSLGPPERASSAPAGSFAISGHDAPHAHMIQADPRNRFVLHTDLGQDRIYVYKFDSGQRTTHAGGHSVRLPSRGRRAKAFRISPQWALVLLHSGRGFDAGVSSTTTRRPGALHHQQTVSALPGGYRGHELLFGGDHCGRTGAFSMRPTGCMTRSPHSQSPPTAGFRHLRRYSDGRRLSGPHRDRAGRAFSLCM